MLLRILLLGWLAMALTGCWGSDDLGSEHERDRSTTGTESVDDEGDLSDDEGDLSDDEGDLSDDEGDLSDDEGDLSDDEGDLSDDEGDLSDDEGDLSDPPVELTEGHLYLPTAAGIRWYYNGGELQATFSGTTLIGGETLSNLAYSNGLIDYVQSDASDIGYGGSRYVMTNASDGLEYSLDIRFPRAHSIFVDSRTRFSGSASLAVQPLDLVYAGIFPYSGRVTPLGIRMIDVGEWGELPAVGMRVLLNPGGRLGDLLSWMYPRIATLLESRSTELWFAPGVGIVQRQDGDSVHTLTSVDGIQQPLLFSIDAGTTTTPAPQQIRLNGIPVTDSAWTVQVLYRTAPTGWLDVAFDGTGSWRARLTPQDQAAGLHAATLRLTRNTTQYDVPVILYVR